MKMELGHVQVVFTEVVKNYKLEHLFGCDKTGDVIQFIQEMESCTK